MQKFTITNKGFIKLGGKVMVSDPCYGLNTWCQGVIENVLPGEYACFVEHSDEGKWGMRVSMIQVIHKDYVDKPFVCNKENFCVGVDSGQAGIFDYKYYERYHTDFSDYDHVDEEWYYMVCGLTWDEHNHHFNGNVVDGFGFVSSSGYGDGSYDCWTAKDNNGNVILIQVEYIGEYDDEEDN